MKPLILSCRWVYRNHFYRPISNTTYPQWTQVCSKVVSNHAFSNNLRDICLELWITEDIVSKIVSSTNAKIYANDVLINPGNANLCGAKLPYFPRGGPVPSKYDGSNNWGGMEAGRNMVYPIQSIDGRVHMDGGKSLKHILKHHFFNKCEIGQCITTKATENLKLKHHYKYVIHAVPPLSNVVKDNDANSVFRQLVSCYRNSFLHVLALKQKGANIVAMPLIGSGTAGFTAQYSCEALRSALLQTEQKYHDVKEGCSVYYTDITLRIVVQNTNAARIANHALFAA